MTREAAPEVASVRVLMSPELMGAMASRTADGYRVVWDWSEPDADGFHTPVVSVDYTDRIGSLDAAWAAVEAALPEGWHGPELFTVGGRRWIARSWDTPLVMELEHAEADTPAAALLALAETLAQR